MGRLRGIEDGAEEIVYQYLLNVSDDVIHHPDGQHNPPDFLVSGELAVEVRRLNENYFADDKPKGLETDQRRVMSTVEKVLREFDRETPGPAYLVGVHFSRPLGNLKRLRVAVEKGLRSFLNAPPNIAHTEIKTRNGLAITLGQLSDPRKETFHLAVQSDGDSGGFLAGIYIRNIRHCVEEKTSKISRHVARYPQWWLVLVNMLRGYSLRVDGDAREIEMIRKSVARPEPWQRILVLDPVSRDVLIDL